ncbi:MAG: TetR/AcrR family transcriptional regulator [Gammaproteobacteria bacterium]
MARRSQHSLEEIKTMVLKAAETLVIEEGAKALTMRNIALEIGYTPGSIYMVFENMSDLILHLNARTLEAMVERFELAPNADPERCIQELARLYLDYARDNFNRWNLLFEHRPHDDAELPDWYRGKIEQAFVRFESEFARLTPERDGGQTRLAARALWGGIHGICMLGLTGKFKNAGSADVDAGVMLLVRNFLDGWRRHDSRPDAF